MDVNDLRVAVTVFSFVLFLGLVADTWNRRRKHEHDEAANLPFSGEQDVNEPRGEKS
ncbi:MAG: CcoQ/FixQ family Cbb3-type cytochrome c oxidase assembly chaperone [Rubrivivax sp.]|nr:CcoQ/FixQ family Cbb3-type cytochrome c oxidase assembly chaperone [Rubrivivax sp.]